MGETNLEKKKCGHKTRAPHHTSRGEVPSDRVEGGCHACALTSTARALLRSVKRSRALIADACEVATGNDFPLGSVEGEECAVASQSHARPVQRLLAGDVGTVLFVPVGGGRQVALCDPVVRGLVLPGSFNPTAAPRSTAWLRPFRATA